MVAEVDFAKNAMLTIGRATPYQAVLGTHPPILQNFEPLSETQCDDMSSGMPAYFRNNMRTREIAIQSIVQQTAMNCSKAIW